LHFVTTLFAVMEVQSFSKSVEVFHKFTARHTFYGPQYIEIKIMISYVLLSLRLCYKWLLICYVYV